MLLLKHSSAPANVVVANVATNNTICNMIVLVSLLPFGLTLSIRLPVKIFNHKIRMGYMYRLDTQTCGTLDVVCIVIQE